MATKAKRPGAGLRRRRQELDLSNAVIVGDDRLGEIVYCYRFPSRKDRLKIGYSSRGLVRVSEQSTAFPEKPEVIFVIHDKRAKVLEEAFHMALSDRQSDVMGTEWFDVTFKDVLQVSPALRRAVGARRVDAILRRSASLGLMGLGLCLYPPIFALASGVHDISELALILGTGRAYLVELGQADLGAAMQLGKSLLSASGPGAVWSLSAIAAGLHIPLLGSLSWVGARPQVG